MELFNLNKKVNSPKEKTVFVKLSARKPFEQAIFIQDEYSNDDTQPLYQADCGEDFGLGVSSSDMSSPDILRRNGSSSKMTPI